MEFSDKSACCVVTASAGYPESYAKGYPITMTDEAKAHTYVAGAKLEGDRLVTSGGRVTGTTAVADTLEEAIRQAYRIADGVVFGWSPPAAESPAPRRWQIRWKKPSGRLTASQTVWYLRMLIEEVILVSGR